MDEKIKEILTEKLNHSLNQNEDIENSNADIAKAISGESL